MKEWKKLFAILLIVAGVFYATFSNFESKPRKEFKGSDDALQEFSKPGKTGSKSEKPENLILERNKGYEEEGEAGIVTRVIDGDTIVVLLNGVEEKVRLIGIDTPERGRPYFEEARQKTAELALGKRVRLQKDVSERDRYGRLLRYVYVGSLFLNAELVKQGYAMVYTYPPDVKHAELFLKLQKEAREAGRGLWSIRGSNASSNGKETQNGATYCVASRKSEVFHLPDCVWAKRIAPQNLIRFDSREEALSSGRRPCKVCNP